MAQSEIFRVTSSADRPSFPERGFEMIRSARGLESDVVLRQMAAAQQVRFLQLGVGENLETKLFRLQKGL